VTAAADLVQPQPRRRRATALASLGAGLALAGGVALLAPAYRGLVGYGLYAIPAHLLISFLANEPMLFAAAKHYPAGLVALAGTIGCVIAITLDYALIGWFVNHRLVRTELEDSKGVRLARRVFGKAPFVLIWLSALLPVPFYPVKILAIVGDYPLSRFVTALVIGRVPRFWLLAILGDRMQAPDSALGSAGAALALIGGWAIWRTVRRNRSARTEHPSPDHAARG
jgi:membrane protein YqaA with SNARE-associated domain